MGTNAKGESTVTFDVVMSKAYPLDPSVYKKITGLYKSPMGNAEFVRDGDLLLFKSNGQIVEALAYNGNNTFEGGLGHITVTFELPKEGDTKGKVTVRGEETRTYDVTRFLKY
jgi:hypothetical protein